jgi:UDP-N-acetylmuramate: L-alanyl-gamma-D-glutamyl-meso-diaminopimelate ligase
MHLHILGICGTFMAGVAQIARELGHKVSGSDANTYPPMSTLLAERGIEVMNGFRAENVPASADVCVIGNAMTRGNPEVEYILDSGMEYVSGPQWLYQYALSKRRVIAIAGTHGKTTTTSMVCRILESAGHHCGFLIGGVPGNYDVSARLGESPWFVIEADEYDTAFFDKRSKFVHYRPHIALLNNLEFDHADIFRDVDDIKTQMHHFVRIIPGTGTVIFNADEPNIADTLSRGCWSHAVAFSPTDPAAEGAWRHGQHDADWSRFTILSPAGESIEVEWSLFGAHNAANALAAAAVCHTAGATGADVADGLARFIPPRRRLQLIVRSHGVHVYEDFAHHPTAIGSTLDALASRHPASRLIAVVEARSSTMQSGVHSHALVDVLARPAVSLVLRGPGMRWNPADLTDSRGNRVCEVFDDAPLLVERLMEIIQPGDVIALMSNGGFQGLPALLAGTISAQQKEPNEQFAVNR